MPEIVLTLTDTPTGGVAIHSSFVPAVGNRCSPAQAAALEILARTRKDWGTPNTLQAPAQVASVGARTPVAGEVDIDAVHRTRDRVVNSTTRVLS